MKTQLPLKKILFGAGLFFLLMGINSCSDDDDTLVVQPNTKPTGSILVDENQTLTGNILIIKGVTVGQDSWLAAVYAGAKTTNSFIAQPVRISKGTHTNVELIFDEGALSNDEAGNAVVVKLYADNQKIGTRGQWDVQDIPIRDSNNAMVARTITVFVYDSDFHFNGFDTNGDRALDAAEVLATYESRFTDWDTNDDNFLGREEFYHTTFAITDGNVDNGISKEEWEAGFAGLYRNWSDDDFADFDTNADEILNLEEWNAIFKESGWFESYDLDLNNFITEEEWNKGLFKDWDLNDDNRIDQSEYNFYRPYVISWYGGTEPYTFRWYDINRNGTLDFQEAIETFNFSRYFTEHWDTDGDQSLNKQEFYNSFFINTDYSLNNGISQEEWNIGFSALFSNWSDDEFSVFDTNKNNVLSKNEWINVFNDSGWFEAYDTNKNSVVSLEEWRNGLFVDWDINEDSLIDEEEFDRYIYYVFSWMRW